MTTALIIDKNRAYYCYPDYHEFQTETYRGICITDVTTEFNLEPVVKRFYTAGNVPTWSDVRRAKAHEAFAIDRLMYEAWCEIHDIQPGSGSAFDNFWSDSAVCLHSGKHDEKGNLFRTHGRLFQIEGEPASPDLEQCTCKSASWYAHQLREAYEATDECKAMRAAFAELDSRENVTEEEGQQFYVARATAFYTFLEKHAATI